VSGTLAADVPLRPLSDPPQYGLDHAKLVARGGSNGPGAAREWGNGRAERAAEPAQADANAAWLVAPDKLLILPSTEPTYYPYLDPRQFLATGLRNSGYATAATLSPSGSLQVVTWVEIDEGSRVDHRVFLSTWHDGGWEVEDLTSIDLFPGSVEFERVVGMDYCTSGELWLVTAAGGVAVRGDGERTDGLWTTYGAAEGLFAPGELPTDIGCGEDGSVWIGSMSGLLGYGFEAPPVRLYAPFVADGRG
jgi:hypothetical protein